MHIYLIGFMGAGKTTVGKLLAKALNREFIDLDERIEQEAGLGIPEIFEKHGETYFRQRESTALRNISHFGRKVIATGGGIVLAPKNRETMKRSGVTVYLSWPAEVLFRRIHASQDRPLLKTTSAEITFDHVQRMVSERIPLYQLADVTITGDEGTSPEQTLAMILEQLPITDRNEKQTSMNSLHVNLGERTYPLIVASDSLSECGKEIHQYTPAKIYVVVTDENVDRHYSGIVRQSLEAVGSACYIYKITPGEESKSMSTAESIFTWLLAHRFHREIVMVALGGGVVGDLAGFIAATFLRGVRFVQIPTSLLAQVDSSVGGKVGINHPLAKNSIGAFYQPHLVWIDPTTTRTLPEREIYNGLAEVIKYGLILDSGFFNYLEAHLDDIISLDNADSLMHVIHTCCQLKADVVEKDERESGMRRVLNFGHTIGHALEKLTDYAYFRHGEAVIWGMLAATTMSQEACQLPSSDADRIRALLQRLEKPSMPRRVTVDAILDAIKVDKKMTDAGLQFVLLEAIGACTIQSLDYEIVRTGIEAIFAGR